MNPFLVGWHLCRCLKKNLTAKLNSPAARGIPPGYEPAAHVVFPIFVFFHPYKCPFFCSIVFAAEVKGRDAAGVAEESIRPAGLYANRKPGKMAEIVAGVALQEGWNIIKLLAGQRSKFKKQYKELESALKSLSPVLDQLLANREVEAEALLCEMRIGLELMTKCAQVSRWNFIKQAYYSRRLEELAKAIQESAGTATLMGVLALKSRMGEVNTKLDKLLGGDGVTEIRSGGSVAALPPLPGKVFGIEKPLNELKRMLQMHQVVGVCGMGGSGKSTLVNSLCRDPNITGFFGKNIFYFMVSRTPDTLDILKRIWSQLLGGEEPRFKDVEDAVRQIAHGLSEQQIKYSGNGLIVLDDVWSVKDLKNLLFRTERLKTIVISREKMKKNIVDEIYPLPKLETEAAKQLFYHAAGKASPIYTMAAEQIIKRCDGLPMALDHIGGRLNGEPIQRWDDITEVLQNKGDIYKSEEDLFSVFSPTIDSLCQQLRDCFLDIGFFPEDKRLPAASIIDMWVELYHLTEKKAFLKLFELSEKHLLNLTWRTRSHTIDGGNFHDVMVSQHDLLRDLALRCWTLKGYTERKRLAMNGKEGDASWSPNHDDAEIVSWKGCEANYSTMSNINFRDAKVLILNFSAGTYEHLPPFLWSMENLRTLIITNHSLDQAKITKLQSGTSSLRNIRRMRLERISLPVLFEIEDPLFQSLQKLSLFFCEFSQSSSHPAPENISAIFPELEDLEIHYATNLAHLPPAVCEMRKLQKLSITKCPDLKSLPEGLNQLTNLKYLNIYACSSLEGLPDSICGLKNLKVLDLCDCSMVERLPKDLGSLSCLARIDMRQCSRINELPTSVMQMRALELVFL